MKFETKKQLRKQIYDLQRDNSWQKERIEDLEKENKKLKTIISGERVCGSHCQACANSIKSQDYNMMGYYTSYKCKLDIKCKEFKEVEA